MTILLVGLNVGDDGSGTPSPAGQGSEALVDFLSTTDFPDTATAFAAMETEFGIPTGTHTLAYTILGVNAIADVVFPAKTISSSLLVLPESVRNANDGVNYLNESSSWVAVDLIRPATIINVGGSGDFGNVDSNDSPNLNLPFAPDFLTEAIYNLNGQLIFPPADAVRSKTFSDSAPFPNGLVDGDEYWLQTRDLDQLRGVLVRFDITGVNVTLTAIEVRRRFLPGTGDYDQDFNVDLTGTVLDTLASSPATQVIMVESIILEFNAAETVWDAKSRRVINGETPIDPDDLTTKVFVEDLTALSLSIWSPTRTYVNGQIVIGSDGEDYSSLTSGNLDNDPTEPPPINSAVFSGDSFFTGTQDQFPTGIHFSPDGLIMFVSATQNDNVSRYDLAIPFDITTAVFLNDFSFLAQDTVLKSVFFSPDGKIMMLGGALNERVYRYNLSTGFDLTTAVFLNFLSIVAQETNLEGIHFTSDGKILFMTGSSSDAVHRYDLTTGFDLTTATFISSFSVSSETNAPQDVFISETGKTMLVVGIQVDRIHRYLLSTPFDITTAVFKDFFSLGGQDTVPRAIDFSPDGTKMFMVGDTNNAVFAYDLPLTWAEILNVENFVEGLHPSVWEPARLYGEGNIVIGSDGEDYSSLIPQNGGNDPAEPPSITTAIFSGDSFSVGTQDIFPTGFHFSPDGLIMFISGNLNDTIYRYNLLIPFDITTATFLNDFSVLAQDVIVTDVHFSPDGKIMFMLGAATDRVFRYNLTIGFDLTTAVFLNFFSVVAQENSAQGMHISEDGKDIYVTGFQNMSVHRYALSIGFDLTTAAFVNSFSVSAQTTQPQDVFISESGKIMLIVGSVADRIYNYTLSVPFDITTAVFVASLPVGAQDTTPKAVDFSSNGERMFLLGDVNDSIFRYDLPPVPWAKLLNEANFETESLNILVDFLDDTVRPAFDIQGAAFTVSTSVAAEDVLPNGITFSANGARMFLAGSQTDRVIQYDLGTPFDPTTKVFNGVFLSVSAQDTSITGVQISVDGSTLFIAGIQNARIYQYNLPTPNSLVGATFTKFLSVAGQETSPRAIVLKVDGSGIYMVGITTDTVFLFNLLTPNDLTGATVDAFTLSISSEETAPRGMDVSPNGTILLITGFSSGSIHQYRLPNPGSLQGASFTGKSISVATEDTVPTGITFRKDTGAEMFMVGDINDTISSYKIAATEAEIIASMQTEFSIPDRTFQLAYTLLGVNKISTVAFVGGVGVINNSLLLLPDSVLNVNEGLNFINNGGSWRVGGADPFVDFIAENGGQPILIPAGTSRFLNSSAVVFNGDIDLNAIGDATILLSDGVGLAKRYHQAGFQDDSMQKGDGTVGRPGGSNFQFSSASRVPQEAKTTGGGGVDLHNVYRSGETDLDAPGVTIFRVLGSSPTGVINDTTKLIAGIQINNTTGNDVTVRQAKISFRITTETPTSP